MVKSAFIYASQSWSNFFTYTFQEEGDRFVDTDILDDIWIRENVSETWLQHQVTWPNREGHVQKLAYTIKYDHDNPESQ